jgi:hypothetical protein
MTDRLSGESWMVFLSMDWAGSEMRTPLSAAAAVSETIAKIEAATERPQLRSL